MRPRPDLRVVEHVSEGGSGPPGARRPGPRGRRPWSMWPAVAAVVSHVALREVLDPWLNAASDAKFWAAVAVLVTPLAFALYAAVRAIRFR